MDQKSSSSPENFTYPWQKSYPSYLQWDKGYTPKPQFHLLDQAVELYGGSVCTDFMGKTLTYAEIGAACDQIARGLQDLGVKKGDKVGLFLPNSPTYVIYYFAILKVGGVVVNYNPLYTVEELEFQALNSETELMVTLDLKVLFEKCDALMQKGALKQTVVAPFKELLPGIKSFLFGLLKSGELANIGASASKDKCVLQAQLLQSTGAPEPVEIDPLTDLAVLQYTGGTTGRPKGAMLTHANIYINTQQAVDWAPDITKGEEVFMGILPFFHVFAMTCVMNFSVAVGARMILMPKFELHAAIKLMAKTSPTCMPGVPTLFNALLNAKKLPESAVENLKFCLSGGAPLPLEVKHGFEALADCSLIEGYGLSETSPILTANVPEGEIIEGSIGIPFPQTVISLRSLDDPSVEVALGENGEICSKGPQVMKGYWNAQEATDDVFVGEFFRTGDVGYMDEKGYTYIVDRIKDLIICSGFNVYPRKIEDALYKHPAVEETTVVGIPDDYRGEAPKAFVKLKEGHQLKAAELMSFLEDKLSKLEMPEEIEFRDELPKTMVGKLSKKELREK